MRRTRELRIEESFGKFKNKERLMRTKTAIISIAELKADAQYAAVTDVALTDDGRRALERADASPSVAGEAAIQ